jgi:hypothetical protein
VTESKEMVLAVHPTAYTCSEERESTVFITRGPGKDLSGKFPTENEAWDDAASRLPALPTEEVEPEFITVMAACDMSAAALESGASSELIRNPRYVAPSPAVTTTSDSAEGLIAELVEALQKIHAGAGSNAQYTGCGCEDHNSPDCCNNARHIDDVWTDVTRMLTLNGAQHSKGKEMHLCPMQFDIADRIIEQFTMPGEMVFDPFGGLMTVPYRAVLKGRRGMATELNPGYFLDGCSYLAAAERQKAMPTLFDMLPETTKAAKEEVCA